MKLAILFGSSSNEHEVSVISASSIIKNLNKEKYEITPIYMNKQNEFFYWKEDISTIKPLEVGILPTKLKKIEKPFLYLQQFDLVFLMIHGKNGEDGVLSNILDFLNIKYIGNKATSSNITMDKILTKEVLEANYIKTTPYLSFQKYNEEFNYRGINKTLNEIIDIINQKLKYPVFVKPANSGSSIGISKVTDKNNLMKAIETALKVDHRILVEEEVCGREIECGILEKNKRIIASTLGEVKSAEDYYSFTAKYTNKKSYTVIPAKIDKAITLEIQNIALKAFKILDLHKYSRCDFFLTEQNEIILNEINTIPGFTEISMYPRLFDASGISYSELLDILIKESLKEN